MLNGFLFFGLDFFNSVPGPSSCEEMGSTGRRRKRRREGFILGRGSELQLRHQHSLGFYSAVCQKERWSWVRGREGTGILRQSDSSEIHPKSGFPGFPETANYFGFSAKSWTENAEGIKFTPFVKQTLPFLY